MMRDSLIVRILLFVLVVAIASSSAHAADDGVGNDKSHGALRSFIPATIANIQKSNKTACDVINPEDLPPECTCSEPNGPLNLVVECTKKFTNEFFNDTIGMKINLDPCNPEGSKLSLDVTEKEHGIDYTIAGIQAGEEKNIPIPGLSIVVPSVGHMGIDVAVYIAGNPDSLILKVGLNACAVVAQHTVCASSVPGLNRILPWYVLSGTYSFGDVCESINHKNNNNNKDNMVTTA